MALRQTPAEERTYRARQSVDKLKFKPSMTKMIEWSNKLEEEDRGLHGCRGEAMKLIPYTTISSERFFFFMYSPVVPPGILQEQASGMP